MGDGMTGVRALVAGGTGGIGSAVCTHLMERGADVAFTYRGASARVAELVSAGARAAFPTELTDPVACATTVRLAVEALGGLNVLVHAAGPLVPMTHLSRVSPEEFHDQLVADAASVFNLLSPALDPLRATRGSIVVVTTAATDRFPVRDGLSAAPKAAVEALVRGIAVEEGRFGVRANCVGPGMLSDGMAERLIAEGQLDARALEVARASIPLRRFGTAADIAEAVCFLASPHAGFITGQKINVDGGFTA